MGYFSGILGYIPIFAEVFTIVTISCYRLWMLIRPLHMRMLRPRHVFLIMAVLWILPLSYILIKIGIGQHAYFDPYMLCCNSNGKNVTGIYKLYSILSNSTFFKFYPLDHFINIS